MHHLKQFLLILKYIFSTSSFNTDYINSLFNALKYKLFYERKKPVVFYDRYPVHHSFSRPLMMHLAAYKEVVLFVGDKKHPALRDKLHNIKVIFINSRFEKLFLLLKIPIFITPASNFKKYNKPKNSNLIHMFHSIVSMHYIYPEDVFDGYDTFFAVGPHHIQELKRTEQLRSWKDKVYLEVGYPKIEELIHISNLAPNSVNEKTILLAPSWGEYNLLKLHGIEMIETMLKLNYKVIVRPHPHSFANDMNIIQKIRNICSKDTRCSLEDSGTEGMDSYLKSSLMISDWSGAAYEYAFGLLKPVLFIDIPKKINNSSMEQRQHLPMEYICREKVGKISSIENFSNTLVPMLKEQEPWSEKIKLARKEYLFNPYNSTNIASNIIRELQTK